MILFHPHPSYRYIRVQNTDVFALMLLHRHIANTIDNKLDKQFYYKCTKMYYSKIHLEPNYIAIKLLWE